MPSTIKAAPTIDWNEVCEEAVGLLRAYLRIDTTNPPGGEEAGAVLLRDVLEREGIATELHDAGGARVSLSARLQGSAGTNSKPLVLLSHIDVVPVEAEHWKVAPFSGELVDGVLWGRGALDMKGMGIMELMVMLLAKRHGIELARDLVFLAVADEEEGGRMGVGFVERTAQHLLDADTVFNEGAYGFCELMGQQTKLFGVGPSEKSPCWIKLVSRGEPGHASVPHGRNALVKLVQALARIEEREQRAVLSPAVEAMMSTLRQRGLVPAELDPGDPQTLAMLTSVDAHLRAITRDTVSLTGVHSGHKHNVIPVSAEATLDCRLLPDTDPEAFIASLEAMIDDPDIEVVRVLAHVSGSSSLDTPAVSIIRDVIGERYGDEAGVLPVLSPGFTDSHAYRRHGANAYGFTPVLLTREELATIHGHNERISVENLRLGTEILFEVCRRLAARA